MMEENITLSFDSQCSPRTADDILFDLSAVRDSEINKDGEEFKLSQTVADKDGADQLGGLHLANDDIIVNFKEAKTAGDKVNEESSQNDAEIQPTFFDQNNSNIGCVIVEGLVNNSSNIEHDHDRQEEADAGSSPDLDGANMVKYSEEGQCNVQEKEDDIPNIPRQSKEFSDVLTVTDDPLTNRDGFTSIEEHEDKDEPRQTSMEIEGEADIHLDNIMMQEKQQESDSGSEFDFELPATKTTLKPGVVPVESIVQEESNIVSSDEKGREEKETTGPVPSVPQVLPSDVIEDEENTREENQSESHLNGTTTVLEAAQNEWDKVKTIQAGFLDGDHTGLEPTVIETVPPMSPYELTKILKDEDFTSVKSSIKVCIERKGFAAFVNYFFGPPKLKRQLLEEKERIFCVAATQLMNDNAHHLRTLQTIYRTLTGSKFDCARYGSHWEEIGFQGTDPGTDFRSVGILGLVNLLFLLKNPKTHTLASDIYRLSLHPTQNFPFCVMGINLTKITLQVLREDLLNKECNKRGEVLEVVSEFYAGLYLLLYQVWKGQNKSISDSGFVIKEIELRARKNTAAIFKNLDEYLNRKTKIVTDLSNDKETGNLEFVNVCDNS